MIRSSFRAAITAGFLFLAAFSRAAATDLDVNQKLTGFDAYMAKILSDWNAPGIGVGIVVNDKLVFAKGYGFRDYEKKLPFTPETLCPIASNTKLFTAVAAGMLVEEGKLSWDKPVRDSVPEIHFFNDQLTNSVTLRDMLSHRTGITRHDTIWYKSDFTRKELFDKLVYLEPQESLRQTFLYNNLMFSAVGYIIGLKSGKPWEEFVQQRLLDPLDMRSTVYTIADMLKKPDFGVGFTEKRDSNEIYRIPYYEDIVGVAPCGAIISNIDDMSHWLIALMNDGKYQGKQVLPPAVLKATLEPAIALPNTLLDSMGWSEILNSAYGMGRETASYRGHLLSFHGGALPGFHSQVSLMPQEHIGVIVLTIGDHTRPLINVVSYNIYERLLGMDLTPWSERQVQMRLNDKQAGTEARAKSNQGQVPNTQPSHALADYVADYENSAYGDLHISLKDNQLQFDFHKIRLPLTHFHYDRFDTPDDEQDGKWSVNFRTDPQGDINEAVISLDEAEATFTRKPPAIDPKLLLELTGTYKMPDGLKIEVSHGERSALVLKVSGQPAVPLTPLKGLIFKTPQFADLTFEFLIKDGQVTALKQKDPSGEYTFPKL
ncbi:MAG: serine hydrolase [Verrucomicrobia bacterium]|nr:serine hydrolase [Verrucomicrobiota bacterium]MBV8277520.1 serine hydrolase [Verrucomicrobiota bacterium]